MSQFKTNGQEMTKVSVTTGGTGQSDSSRLKKLFPDGPQYTETATTIVNGIDDIAATLGAAMDWTGYMPAYKLASMRGVSPGSIESFGENVDMSYGTTGGTLAEHQPPGSYGGTTPTGEAARGHAGSTISFSARGPNISPGPIDQPGVVPPDLPMADMKPAVAIPPLTSMESAAAMTDDSGPLPLVGESPPTVAGLTPGLGSAP
jgi:hypothetical protein